MALDPESRVLPQLNSNMLLKNLGLSLGLQTEFEFPGVIGVSKIKKGLAKAPSYLHYVLSRDCYKKIVLGLETSNLYQQKASTNRSRVLLLLPVERAALHVSQLSSLPVHLGKDGTLTLSVK